MQTPSFQSSPARPLGWSGRQSPSASPSAERLEQNLRALALHSPSVAEAIEQADESGALTMVQTPDGLGSAAFETNGRSIALASKRRPGEEAQRFASTHDIKEAPVAVVAGFGVGHHAHALADRVHGNGIVMIFEPDIGLLRWVLSRFDHSGWLASDAVRFVTDENDRGRIATALRGGESLGMMGTQLLEHTPSKGRLGSRGAAFVKTLTSVMRSVRTSIATTLVHSGITLRNQFMNLAVYDGVAGIADLRNIAPGSPAVVVSAGPSLARNVDLLRQDWVRDRVVIVAVQTVLKTLLNKGIRPHFVTALDHHEISKRFYEGLTEDDVRGVTLVAEAKSNSEILDSFPGDIRCPGDQSLDLLLGVPPDMNGESPRGTIGKGATVAHLAYYFARYLGCNPVALIGQDLAFTDGQYYAPNAAIHRVWGPELGEFRTLEMFEWERIARMRRTLHAATDHLGRPVYSDEQMQTYLTQFEREFLRDQEQGLTTIDATEGGIRKRGTDIRTLAECLEAWKNAPELRLPAASRPRPASPGLRSRVLDVRQSAHRVVKYSREAEGLLQKMLDAGDDARAINDLVGKAHELRDLVREERPAFDLTTALNQVGVFNRVRADRNIAVEQLEGIERQRAQIERDKQNVSWLADAGEELCRLLDAATVALAGGPKLTRNDQMFTRDEVESEPKNVWAFVPVLERSGLNTARPLTTPIGEVGTPLRLTLDRLAASGRLRGVVLAGPDTELIRSLIDGWDRDLEVRVIGCDEQPMLDRLRSVGASRAFAPGAWRGGPGGLTVFDELLHFEALATARREAGADAMVLVGPDWCFVDPALIDLTIERFEANPGHHKLCFVQAPPGLGGCLLETELIESLEERGLSAGVMGTIGGLLGYHPALKQTDPIAGGGCVSTPAEVRDLHARFIADHDAGRELLASLAASVGVGADAAVVCAWARSEWREPGPSHVTIEVGAPGDWVSSDEVAEAMGSGVSRGLAAVTLRGADDAALHPELAELIRTCRARGATAVHVRTSLRDTDGAIESLIGTPDAPDIISADLLADDELTFSRLTGRDDFRQARRSLIDMIRAREPVGGMAMPWVAPRLTRRDDVYEAIEAFYDDWIRTAGTCVIDPLPEPIEGERIRPLPVPDEVRARMARTELTVGGRRLVEEAA